MRTTATLILFAFLTFFPTINIFCQTSKPARDKFILLTTPYNQRPLTLYRGEFSAAAGYKFAVRAQSYDSDGNLVYLKNNGTGSVYHYYFLEARYGVLDFLEIGAETSFLRRGIREATTTLTSVTVSNTEKMTINKLTESKGMGDIFLYGALRLPAEFKWIDISIKGGLFLPSAKYQTQKPTNTVTSVALSASNTATTVNLHYNLRNGYGVPVYLLSASAKFTLKKFTVDGEYEFRTPMKEGNNIRWEETLADKLFSYYDKSYSYLLSNTHTVNASIHYQATGWFNINMNTSYFSATGGWTEYWGNKYANPGKKLLNLEPGIELQISPSLIISQVAGFPLKGRNNDAPFYLFTTLSYKLFPFLK